MDAASSLDLPAVTVRALDRFFAALKMTALDDASNRQCIGLLSARAVAPHQMIMPTLRWANSGSQAK